ncbi:hypothetical protein BDA96_06G179500 [Sorghum bicolor]|uniref:Uncharacterized protein n=2 Tax=Sorghum bicolor TaxID=4558 RepID=A0A921QR27_SORBI|nr:hypothetical protein BDA96_06G179500 [Sorghum bicolor]OQU82039.1 hypothetical protein SORBI_3006G163066 [Sorghum bicolor]
MLPREGNEGAGKEHSGKEAASSNASCRTVSVLIVTCEPELSAPMRPCLNSGPYSLPIRAHQQPTNCQSLGSSRYVLPPPPGPSLAFSPPASYRHGSSILSEK